MDSAFLMLSPDGRLLWHGVASEATANDLSSIQQLSLASAFSESSAAGLLTLLGKPYEGTLPTSVAWWRGFAREYMLALSQLPRLRDDGWQGGPPSPNNEAAELLVQSVPPLLGMEHLSVSVIFSVWSQLNDEMGRRVAELHGNIEAVVTAINPVWRLVGRITLHLAENKSSPEFPFAFLATYSHRVDVRGRVQHLPLGQALRDSAAREERSDLQALLRPLDEVSCSSALLKEMIESRRIFQALAWTPDEAWQFLREVPVMEDAGLIVKIPNWWSRRRGTKRAVVEVTVERGEKRPGMGTEAILRFDVAVAMGGEKLTPAEVDRILSSEAPLISLKGQWVEVDRVLLREALAKWQRAAAAHANGIPFHIGLRLMAGLGGGLTGMPAMAEEAEWVSFAGGERLAEMLKALRDPVHATATPRKIPGLLADLRPYQITGVNWLELVGQCGFGACLADDMGLGKTIQVIALMLLRRQARNSPRPSLLVVPASLLGNWRRELANFAPSLECIIAHRSACDSAAMRAFSHGTHPSLQRDAILLTTYTTLGKLDAFADIKWDIAVLDEAQAIKNADSAQTRIVKKLRSHYRIALTGTPVENRLTDLWSLFDYLNPGLLGSATAFVDMTRRMAKDGNYAPLRQLVQPCILRRMKTDPDVAPDLPAKTEMTAYCHLSKRQATLYQRAVNAMAKELAQAEDDNRRQGVVLGSLMRLKQICNHPSLFNGDATYAADDSGKYSRLQEICQDIASQQERVLVFTQFREMTDPLTDFLTIIFHRPGLILHGGTPIAKRQQLVGQFQAPDGPPFFVISLKAGGTGLTLTAASHVIHFDRWWNPAVEDQATDRAFRIGQTKNVLVHKFVCEGTLEERIDELLCGKKALANDILSPDAGAAHLLIEMSDDELMRFVNLGGKTEGR